MEWKGTVKQVWTRLKNQTESINQSEYRQLWNKQKKKYTLWNKQEKETNMKYELRDKVKWGMPGINEKRLPDVWPVTVTSHTVKNICWWQRIYTNQVSYSTIQVQDKDSCEQFISTRWPPASCISKKEKRKEKKDCIKIKWVNCWLVVKGLTADWRWKD